MTPEQVDLVAASMAALGDRLDELVARFYERLFDLDPGARALFAADPTEQRAKFAAELAVVVTSIRRHDRFVATTADLGRRHGAIGVGASHFRTAGRALLDAMASTLGSAWTPELATAWRLAYRLTAEMMMAAAGPAPPPGG